MWHTNIGNFHLIFTKFVNMHKSILDSDIQFLPGVGPKRALLLKSELEVFTIGDLLHLFPFRYIDRSTIQKIGSITTDAAYVQVLGQVISSSVTGVGRKQRLSVVITDDTSQMELVFFRGIKYTAEKLKTGSTFLFFGKPSFFNGKLNMVHPEIDFPPTGGPQNFSGTLTGVYASTEKLKNGGITGRVMNKMMDAAIGMGIQDIQETLPDYILREKGLCPLNFAIRNIHFPVNQASLDKARYRLKWEELFLLQLSLLKQKYIRSRNEVGIKMLRVGSPFNACYNALPYSLTDAQKRVIKEIRADLMSGHQMNRLLQGDVGSGKTMVAVLTALIAIGNDYQACIMAPTEVLAQQHYANISKYLAPTGIHCELLTGSTTPANRKPIHEGLRDGSLKLIIGTHALLEDDVIFKNLGLAIIDEQHRFGVDQRSKLWAKGNAGVPPHVLVMTATPIPRTLAMTLYGDLDVSIIDEMPPGRKPVKTYCFGEAKRPVLYKFMAKQISLGRQIFIVYPLIFESEKLDYQNLEKGYEDIVEHFPYPGYKVAIVHGQQSNEDKMLNMNAFTSGRANILVSTTVIEVGVDVPNASVMVIESAERFGLSQLHQLRGRVGRGSEESFCVLMHGRKVSNESMKRLNLMCATENGFDLAEEDMKMRGPGDLEGTQQSGLPIELNIASLTHDGTILSDARSYAEHILAQDPTLEKAENESLAAELRKDKYNVKDYSKIS